MEVAKKDSKTEEPYKSRRIILYLGHKKKVHSVELASSSVNQTSREPQDQNKATEFQVNGHCDGVDQLRSDPNHTDLVATTSEDTAIRPWDAGSGKCSLLENNCSDRSDDLNTTACATAGRKCLHCGSKKTPQWRAGPSGPKTLCNACGVRYRSGRLCAEYRPANSPTFSRVLHSSSHREILKMRRQKNKADEIEYKGHTSVDQLWVDPKHTDLVATASGDKTVGLRDARSGKWSNLEKSSSINRKNSNDRSGSRDASACVTASVNAVAGTPDPSKFPSLSSVTAKAVIHRTRRKLNMTKRKDVVTQHQHQRTQYKSKNRKQTKVNSTVGKKCLHCGSKKTPRLRIGPLGPNTLCGPCGIRYKSGRLTAECRPSSCPAFSRVLDSNSGGNNSLTKRQKAMKENKAKEKLKFKGHSVGVDGLRLDLKHTDHVATTSEDASHSTIRRFTSSASLSMPNGGNCSNLESNCSDKSGGLNTLACSTAAGNTVADTLTTSTPMKLSSLMTKSSKITTRNRKVVGIERRLQGSRDNLKNRKQTNVRECLHCGSKNIPQWCAGPFGLRTLCNACGVHDKSELLSAEYSPASSPTFSDGLHSDPQIKILEMRQENKAEESELKENSDGAILKEHNDGDQLCSDHKHADLVDTASEEKKLLMRDANSGKCSHLESSSDNSSGGLNASWSATVVVNSVAGTPSPSTLVNLSSIMTKSPIQPAQSKLTTKKRKDVVIEHHHDESQVNLKNRKQPNVRECLHCGSRKTPQWLVGPLGPRTLCNACGVRYKSERLCAEYRPASSATFSDVLHSNSQRKILKVRQEAIEENKAEEIHRERVILKEHNDGAKQLCSDHKLADLVDTESEDKTLLVRNAKGGKCSHLESSSNNSSGGLNASAFPIVAANAVAGALKPSTFVNLSSIAKAPTQPQSKIATWNREEVLCHLRSGFM